MAGRAILIVLALMIASTCYAETTLEQCLFAVGFPGASQASAWEASVALTVSSELDASLIVLDKQGAAHASYLIFNVLRTMAFSRSCTGRRLQFRVVHEPSADSRYGISLKNGKLLVTSYTVSGTRNASGGPLEIDDLDLVELARTPSLKSFLRRRGLYLRH